MALADERGLMGARSTAVISSADADATRAGYRLARDYFFGEDPVFARGAESGLLVKRRDVDVCRYVSPTWDEAVNVPTFSARPGKVKRLQAAISRRLAANEQAERSMSVEEKRALKESIVNRPLPPNHGRRSLLEKIYLR